MELEKMTPEKTLYLLQVWNKNTPDIEIYTPNEFMKLSKNKKDIGYAKIEVREDNNINLCWTELDYEHLEAYSQMPDSKKNLKTIVVEALK